MRLVCDRVGASAVRPSIAAAMVIVEPVFKGIIYGFRLESTFAKKCQQRVMTMPLPIGGKGREFAIRQYIGDEFGA
jgi:hypothetical protein